MHIVFGWSLDGITFPESGAGRAASFNSSVAGPAELLRLLETRLGLPRPQVPRALRVAQYLSRLQAADDGARFYSTSLAVDAWSTADYLLGMRDELIAAGWDGRPVAQSERLSTLSDCEYFAGDMRRRAPHLEPESIGERLLAVNAALTRDSKRVFNRLQVLGAIEHLPDLYRKTIEALRASGTDIEPIAITAAATAGDLQTLQKRLLFNNGSGRIDIAGDQSITLIDADDEVQAAELTAAWLYNQEDLSDTLLIRGSDSCVLNQACRRYGLPQIGTPARSQFRAILQVLPLAFELAWRPIDPKKIIEFVWLEGGPISGWVARNLSDALAEAPGIGGERWQAAWKKTFQQLVDYTMRDDIECTRTDAEQKAKETIDGMQAWFAELAPSSDSSMSKSPARENCSRVERWAQGRAPLGGDTNALYAVAAGHAKMLKQLVEMQAGALSLAQLRRMIDAVTAYGVSFSTMEAAPWTVIDDPGKIWQPVSTVCWWGFAQPQWPAFRPSIWSHDELKILRNAGIQLESAVEKLRRESFAWKLPVLNARDRLLLVKPRAVAGERAVAHPLWDEMVSVMQPAAVKAISVSPASMFASMQVAVAGRRIACDERQAAKLPGKLRTWNIPPQLVKARARESFSSMEKLLGCPLAWVLNYSCRMSMPKSLDLPEKQLLLGKLAHAVVSEMFAARKQWQVDEAIAFARNELNRLVPEMAAGLLLPGQASQLREAKEAIPSSVGHLVELLQGAQLTVEGCEISLQAPLNSETVLIGALDLLARLPDGRPVILDLKWSSAPYFYRRRIVDGKALQLAIYSWLATQTPGTAGDATALPAAGFFMFRHAQLFFTSEGIFPDYATVRKPARSLDETWNLTREYWSREMANLQEGTVVATDVDHDSKSFEECMYPPMADPPCKFCRYGHFCGKEEVL